MRPPCQPFRPRANGRTLRSVGAPPRRTVPRVRSVRGTVRARRSRGVKTAGITAVATAWSCASRGGGRRAGVESPALTTACTPVSGAGSRTEVSAARSILTGSPRTPLVSDWGSPRESRVPPQVSLRTIRALVARAGSFATPIPTVRQFLKRGVARALPPRVLCAAPERIPRGRIGSVDLGRDFLSQ